MLLVLATTVTVLALGGGEALAAGDTCTSDPCHGTGGSDLLADDADVSIVNGESPQSSSSELRGKADISKYLRAAFGQETYHRVEQEVVGEERVTFRETRAAHEEGGRMETIND